MTFFNRSIRTAFALACSGAFVVACDGKRGMMEEAAFRVETVALEKIVVKRTDAFGLAEMKEFAFKACITDGQSRGAIAITRFTVSDGQSGRSVPTDSSGCMEWKEIHTFSSLQKEQSMRMDRTFTNDEGIYAGSVTVSLAFNPWQDTLVDLRRDQDPDLEPQGAAMVGFDMNLRKDPLGIDPFSEAAMADVKLDFTGHDIRNTELTSLLTLKPAQRFRLSLKPQFIRRNVRNEQTFLDLRGGQFRVRLVVIGEDAEQPVSSDIVAYSEATVEVQPNGLAQKDIVVRVHDVAAVLSRNRFFLVMEPIGPAVAMARASVYVGTVGPLAGNNALIDVIPFDGDDAAFILSIDKALSQLHTKVSAMELFETASGLKPEAGSSALRSVLDVAPTSDRAPGLLRDFCSKLYTPDMMTTVTVRGTFGRVREQKVKTLDACIENPANFLRLDRRDIVQEVIGKPRYRPDLLAVKEIGLSRDLKYAKVQSNAEKRDYAHGYGWGGSAGFDVLGLITKFIPVVGNVISAIPGLNLGLGLKANIGTDWMTSEGLGKVEEVGIGATISEKQSFEIASVGYDIDVKVRSCALLAATVGPVRGFYACSQQVKDRSTTESFYQVNHSVTNSVFADALSAGSTMWRVMIRGQENYSAFENLMSKGNGVLQFSTLKIENPKAALLPDFKINQAFPGVISSK